MPSIKQRKRSKQRLSASGLYPRAEKENPARAPVCKIAAAPAEQPPRAGPLSPLINTPPTAGFAPPPGTATKDRGTIDIEISESPDVSGVDDAEDTVDDVAGDEEYSCACCEVQQNAFIPCSPLVRLDSVGLPLSDDDVAPARAAPAARAPERCACSWSWFPLWTFR